MYIHMFYSHLVYEFKNCLLSTANSESQISLTHCLCSPAYLDTQALNHSTAEMATRGWMLIKV